LTAWLVSARIRDC